MLMVFQTFFLARICLCQCGLGALSRFLTTPRGDDDAVYRDHGAEIFFQPPILAAQAFDLILPPTRATCHVQKSAQVAKQGHTM